MRCLFINNLLFTTISAYQSGQYLQPSYPMYVPLQNIVAPMPHQQTADSSVLSNDSGVVGVEQQVYQQQQQPIYSYQYPPQPVPVYYTPAPIQPQTPQVAAQIAQPVFSGPAILQQTPNIQPEAQVPPPFTDQPTAVAFTQSQNSEHIKVESSGA